MSLPELLREALPKWASIVEIRDRATVLRMQPSGPDGSAERIWTLQIFDGSNDAVQVSEANDTNDLPKCCPERHVNEDGTFCLHLDSTQLPIDLDDALSWWRSLAVFLHHQEYAERRGVWPLGAQLSHGDAALIQLEMEALAEPLGWLEEVHLGLFRGQGWLGKNLPGMTGDGRHVVNARSPCPRGCARTSRGGATNICFEHQTSEPSDKRTLRVDCPHRSIVETLIRLEHDRRRYERHVINDLYRKGIRCCGTMKSCPLRDIEGNLSASKRTADQPRNQAPLTTSYS